MTEPAPVPAPGVVRLDPLDDTRLRERCHILVRMQLLPLVLTIIQCYQYHAPAD